MFDQKYIQHLQEENVWLRRQVEELQAKLFKAMRLDLEALEDKKPLRYDPDSKEYVEMTSEQIYAERVALQELLAQNIS